MQVLTIATLDVPELALVWTVQLASLDGEHSHTLHRPDELCRGSSAWSAYVAVAVDGIINHVVILCPLEATCITEVAKSTSMLSLCTHMSLLKKLTGETHLQRACGTGHG